MRNLLLLVLISCTLFTYSQKRDIELSDIWASGTFYPKTINGFVNLNDGKSYVVQEQNEEGYSVINQYDYKSGDLVKELFTCKGIVSSSSEEIKRFNTYHFSEDQSTILVTFNSEAIYRHSTRDEFVVFDIANKMQIGNTKRGKVRYPRLNPTGDKVAYVQDNNLYVLDLIKAKTKKITKDGEYNKIINGGVDWVYEEEFSMSRGFEWNVDGTKIAFYKFDESEVKEWVMPIYGDLYPEQYKFKYPKAGEANSVVKVFVADAKSGKCKEVALGSENDQYLPRIKWTTNPDILSVQRLNRLQNKWELLMVNGTVVSESLMETSKYYVDITDEVFFLKDGKHMIVSSEQDGNKHLYFHKLEGPQIYQITNGNWEVDKVLGVDDKNELIYFTSTEVSPTERHIYSINFQGKDKKRLSTESGWHTAKFSNDYSLALHSYTTASTPHQYVIRDNSWSTIREVETNEDFTKRMEEFNLSNITFDELDANGTKLNYWMIKPHDFDKAKKYPLMMHVYGGPGSQTVKNSFGYSNTYWHQMLANKHDIIIVSVDNRGTGARGEEFEKMTYKQLGKYETKDQIAAAKTLGALSYIDSERIGIWGWSYGGYMSSLCLAKGNDVFKMAIAIAPVSNWRFYDNVYTERFMALPKDNASGYDDNSPINFVKDIKGKYLIVHGTGDDNVHFQNSVMMVDEMIKNNVEFDSEFYPNKNHGIYGGFTRYHLYNRMTNFILENL
ncbi:MAG: S9 family peptidase [Bacteroidia bacterium]|nr:S9 family peptidase [Bacteroidia bacterium]